MAKRKTATEKRSKPREKTPSLWIDTANLPTSIAQRRTKPQAIWRMIPPSVDGSENHYLQLADSVLKRVTFEAPTRIVERPPRLLSKAG